MRRHAITLLSLALLPLVYACGGGQASRLADICKESTNLQAEICDCVADRAETELSPAARELLLAMLEKDEDLSASLRARLSIEDATNVATFFVRAPAACAAEKAGR